jgi:hypothetical protein
VGWIHTYPNFGTGDVVFSLVTPVSGCSGFWLNPSEPGFKQTYTTLMAAGRWIVAGQAVVKAG